MSCSLLWFRQDLRIDDNGAAATAIRRGAPIIPIYIWAPHEEGNWQPGGASKWWLHQALEDLDQQLKELGLGLVVRDASESGTLKALRDLVGESGANAIYWNRLYEPHSQKRDERVKDQLEADGVTVEIFESSLLLAPEQVSNKSGKPFQVFTPLWKHYQTLDIPSPVKVDKKEAKAPGKNPASDGLKCLNLLPEIGWDSGFSEFWGQSTRQSALIHLGKFIKNDAENYGDQRDLPAEDGTTRLSPFLHFGQIGAREAWHRFASAENHSRSFESGIMRQLIWREFAHHLLHHFPHTPEKNLRSDFDLFPWDENKEFLRRWQKGETGYPIVDAGMRQLWQTGWMHNRVRMIVGSLLVKHLLQHWIEGAKWFWDTLVDADLANNTLGWQWIGGCGADAAPYFRIFNPITQGEKFDPDGKYVKTYVPELRELPSSHIHHPWDLGDLDLKGMGVVLGKDYPEPIVEHADGRARALEAFEKLKSRRQD